jgi:hypothetical protein
VSRIKYCGVKPSAPREQAVWSRHQMTPIQLGDARTIAKSGPVKILSRAEIEKLYGQGSGRR